MTPLESDERLARVREALKHWADAPDDLDMEFDQSAPPILVGDLRHLLDLVERLAKEVDGYRAWERSVNEALNSGDGSYRP